MNFAVDTEIQFRPAEKKEGSPSRLNALKTFFGNSEFEPIQTDKDFPHD